VITVASPGCEAALGMTHRALAGTARGSDDYMRQQSFPDRLAALGVAVLVIFGTEDARFPSSSAAAYRVVPGARVELLPGAGHTPMMEDPQATANCRTRASPAQAMYRSPATRKRTGTG
jgi:pimeloyl-ACP methyl ester carboxylesterase